MESGLALAADATGALKRSDRVRPHQRTAGKCPGRPKGAVGGRERDQQMRVDFSREKV